MQLTADERETLLHRLDNLGFSPREMSLLTHIPLREIFDVIRGTSATPTAVDSYLQKLEGELN
jgi:hypothetical protein